MFQEIKLLLAVFIGGGFGSLVRYLFSRYLNQINNHFFWGTFSANFLASLLLGYFMVYFVKHPQKETSYALLLTSGFCGGFSTFSTFSFEGYTLLKNGCFGAFATYFGFSLLVGLVGVLAGVKFGQL